MNPADAAGWVLLEAADCLNAVSGVDGPPGAPTLRRVHFGEAESVVHENCCGNGVDGAVGGQLTVAVGTIVPCTQQSFPSPATSIDVQCAKSWAVPVTVEVVRCGGPSIMDDGGRTVWADVDAQHMEMLTEGWTLACRFGSVLSRSGTLNGSVVGVSAPTFDGDCRSVRCALALFIP